jgi:hypothetical protein
MASPSYAQCNDGCAVEWSGASVIDLKGLPGFTESQAASINNSGQVVGFSIVGGVEAATEWSRGSVMNLGGLSGSEGSAAIGINSVGQAVGVSLFGGADIATEWSGGIGGSIIHLSAGFDE